MELTVEQRDRLSELQERLRIAQIDVRHDSNLIWDFVYLGDQATISSP